MPKGAGFPVKVRITVPRPPFASRAPDDRAAPSDPTRLPTTQFSIPVFPTITATVSFDYMSTAHSPPTGLFVRSVSYSYRCERAR